ncbi:hypothetical protein ONA91_01730 [Micromonospora sp. DR5-3]|uniref:hypothetical protein n=1 Tax=unclassified Micromonospora TaxID=2617518 RepID=UPI0011DA0FA9|nr:MULTISPECIES: hypothetical protein [unclassified Micromonospora]MCW3813179.1 hypothetical protein [Micromonospora sp. DR5-3]TYC25845.1 hypothetical protein FXF52_00240 [Micromonospora sp. MP36]
MISELEEHLTRTLASAADEAPVPAYDPVGAVRGRQRRRRHRRAGLAAACAVALVAGSVLTGVRLAAPEPDHGPEYVFSPDRIPDFANLPEPQKVWPEAVHRLPGRLPDGSRYAVMAVLGDDRYLVARDRFDGEAGPLVLDLRSRTVTVLGTSAVSQGLAMSRVLMAREVDGQAVWFLEGFRNNRPVREAWVAPLDGGPARRLTDLPDGSAPRFSVAGHSIIWEQEAPGRWKLPEGPRVSVRRVSLSGGPAADVTGSQGFVPANAAPWITDQRFGTGIEAKPSGELRNVVTGERLRWKAATDVQFVQCGPTWCAGRGSGDRIALQELDGSNPVQLSYRGELSPSHGGRLAIGQLELPAAWLHLIWDRTTGKAAGISEPRPAGASPGYGWNIQLADFEPEVLTLRATDDQLVVLDLGAIK